MNLAINIVGVGISIVAVAMSVWTSRRAARLSSEQEQLRRFIRINAIYGLIATYELIDDLQMYFWTARKEKRVDKDFVISFLSARVDDLNKIHGSSAYYLWKRTAYSFMPNKLLTEEPIDEIVGQKRARSNSGKRLLEKNTEGVGMTLVALEANLWMSSIDALHRLRLGDNAEDGSQAHGSTNDPAEMQAPRNRVFEDFGAAGAEVARALLHYFDSISILVRLLRYYEPSLSKHLDSGLEMKRNK